MARAQSDGSAEAGYRGLLFFFDWADSLKLLPPEEFKNVVIAMIEYANTGKERPKFSTDIAEAVASLIFSQIERSKVVSERNRQNALLRWGSNRNATAMQPQCDRNAQYKANTKQIQSKAEAKTKQSKANTIQSTERDGGAGFLPSPKESVAVENSVSNDLFERFWEVYPRKVSKPRALKAWEKINPDAELAERIISAVAVAIANDQRFRTEQYTPHPATWLNGEEWENIYGAGNNAERTMQEECPGFDISASWAGLDDVFESGNAQ